MEFLPIVTLKLLAYFRLDIGHMDHLLTHSIAMQFAHNIADPIYQ